MSSSTGASAPGRELGALGRGDVQVPVAALPVPVRRREAVGRWSPASPGATGRQRPSLPRSRSRTHGPVELLIWSTLPIKNSLPFAEQRHNSAGKTFPVDAAALRHPARFSRGRPVRPRRSARDRRRCPRAEGRLRQGGVRQGRPARPRPPLGPDGQGQACRRRPAAERRPGARQRVREALAAAPHRQRRDDHRLLRHEPALPRHRQQVPARVRRLGHRPDGDRRRRRVRERRRDRGRPRVLRARFGQLGADARVHPCHEDARGAVRHPAAGADAVVTQTPATILVVEDESSIASFVSLYLKNAGYGVRTASTGGDALNQVAQEMPGLIVLDLMLPDIDGIEVTKRIRQTSDVPILMLTARDEDVDKIIGLEVGADDYLTKPFNPRELVARVKSILRRATPERRERETEVITHGDLRVDAGRREVTVAGEEVQLAPKEFDLLWELLDHRGLVLTRDQLLERVWGYTFAGDTRTVDVHVRQLRRKLGEASPIVTVWGVGYKVSPAKDAKKDTPKK